MFYNLLTIILLALVARGAIRTTRSRRLQIGANGRERDKTGVAGAIARSVVPCSHLTDSKFRRSPWRGGHCLGLSTMDSIGIGGTRGRACRTELLGLLPRFRREGEAGEYFRRLEQLCGRVLDHMDGVRPI